jgi:hypothetical protein
VPDRIPKQETVAQGDKIATTFGNDAKAEIGAILGL